MSESRKKLCRRPLLLAGDTSSQTLKTTSKIIFFSENSWSLPGLEPPDGNPFHALIGVHPEEEEKESDDEEEDLEEDMEEEEEDGDEEEIHVT